MERRKRTRTLSDGGLPCTQEGLEELIEEESQGVNNTTEIEEEGEDAGEEKTAEAAEKLSRRNVGQ